MPLSQLVDEGRAGLDSLQHEGDVQYLGVAEGGRSTSGSAIRCCWRLVEDDFRCLIVPLGCLFQQRNARSS
jgi:hypothetical protein